MEPTSELVAAARKGKRDAIVELLTMHYPTVWRMASGLTGRADVGRGVVRYIMRRSLRALDHWTDEAAPTRWFQHHTLLTTRRAKKHGPDPIHDTLLGAAPADPGYTAFVRALRSLPMQQREAFILSDGEGMGIRTIAVAMDCSTIAAENHLREATARMRELAGSQYDAFVAAMSSAYKKLGPDEEMSVQNVRARIRRIVIPWRLLQMIKLVVSLVLLAIVLWGTLWIWRIVKHSMAS